MNTVDTKMPVFELKATDVIAPLIVRTWALSQKWLEEQTRLGHSVVESVDMLENRLIGIFKDMSICEMSPKVLGAMSVADEMFTWDGPKKVAD